jgi:ribosome modulation factor
VDTEDINDRIEEAYRRGLKDGVEGLKGEENGRADA